MNEPIPDQNNPLPFKKKKHYRVIKEWYRNGTTFEVGQEFICTDVIYNHYDDVYIFCFTEVKQGYELRWPCSAYELNTGKEYFKKVKKEKL